MEVVARLEVWAFVAFWLWLGLALLFNQFRLPYATVVAAALSWIGAGLLATWMLPPLA
jgi:hypothetical protein